MPIIETLFLVSLIAPPSPEIEQWVRTILSVAIPLLLVSGGLFFIAWRVFRSGKDVWTTLAIEFLQTKEFDSAVKAIVEEYCLSAAFKAAVNDVRKEAEWRFRELMRADIREHNEDTNAHHVWRHGDYTTAIHAIQQRLFDLEKGK